ncbi:Glutathione transferase [Mycena indigotica]|uniref:Glutathione transferase n=1 Tax=Mycena indigotica TaxID=2126181 RepID=A0A8H6SM95_9AGAR|nr:Glutathione transferase [Mycena indigotica]KAF7302001.1 Glutathione transferase [Mycena indigotica]
MSTQKKFHCACTGLALETAQSHSAAQDITLFASCFSPFAQRVWTAMEYLGIPYQYCRNLLAWINSSYHLTLDEVDMRKRSDLLEISPKGLVPALKLNDHTPVRGLHESTVILEFLEELACQSNGLSLLPKDPYARALVRLQCDHINQIIVPSFYRFLQLAQDESAQVTAAQDFRQALETLIGLLERAENDALCEGDTEMGEPTGLGLWNNCGAMNLTDVMVAPYLFRATNVLKYYRAFQLPEGVKFKAWTTRLLEHPAFKVTCSTEQLYLDSYERYAFNRPNISQVGNAINSGKPLP